ncbi:hypothetical protein EDB85DRAFT_2278165 [Lactarius pseudohatsudake]|nr:hypothetical protein EDB85DRAFT_2278165 [Lactarius pseudohatsudake]
MSGHAVADIRNTYGCTFIGLIVSVMLFGIMTLQTWIYYWQYGNRDQKALKLFIAVIFLLDALHTILCIYSVYWYLVLNFGNVEILDTSFVVYGCSSRRQHAHRLYGSTVRLLHWISYLRLVLMQRSFYARRVYIVGGSIVIPIIIVIFGTASFALGLVFLVQIDYPQVLVPLCVRNLVTDIGLGTDSVITTLMTYSVHSGLLTSLCEFFLAMLNSRDYVRGRSSGPSSADNRPDNAFNLSSIRIEHRSEGDKSRGPAVSVTVHRSATTDFPQSKHDHDVESSMVEDNKLVWSLHFSVATTALILILSFEGGGYSL